MMTPRLLLSALSFTCAAAFVPHKHTAIAKTRYDAQTTTSLNAVKKFREEYQSHPTATSSRRAALASLAGLALTAQAAAASVPSSAESSGVLLSAGAYQAEAGFDDFSNGLSMPKYTVDDNMPRGVLDAPPSSTKKTKVTDPAKLEKMQAKAAAAAAKAEAQAEAEAAKRAARAAQAQAQLEANAAKIRAKEEAKARQIAQMSPEQRAKIEAYNAAKKEGKQPNALNNMKRMYGL